MKSRTSTWHSLAGDALINRLGSDLAQGLSSIAAQEKLTQHGENRLTPRRSKSPLRLFLSQFHQPLVYILLLSAIVTAALEEWVDSSVIFGVVLINALIGFIQEHNALRATLTPKKL